MIIATLTFYLFAALMVISALAVVTAKHPVYAVLFLIFCFFNSAGLFVLLGAEFIAMLMVIVYVGAVAVLFLFVVMMLNVDFARLKAGFMRYLPLGIAIAVVMFAELLLVIRQGLSAQTMRVSPEFPITEGVTNTEALGRILYTDYVLIFQVSGLILLVAMVGAIVLTLRVRDGVRKQNISEQLSRKREDCVEVVSVETGKGV
jgi:NADH-quinone oxidoreductase subunit J